jgi:hypothetical protein
MEAITVPRWFSTKEAIDWNLPPSDLTTNPRYWKKAIPGGVRRYDVNDHLVDDAFFGVNDEPVVSSDAGYSRGTRAFDSQGLHCGRLVGTA